MIKTEKHQILVNDPVIRYKPVEALPGIGPVYGRRLRDAGFNTADKVLEQYLVLKRNELRFTQWISEVCDTNSHHAAMCFSGLNEWYQTWGKDNTSIKYLITPRPIQNHLTNRMLLQEKILRFNFNSSDDSLRRLTQCQTMSLYDISKPQRAIMDTINKSEPNIFSGLQYSSEANLKSSTANNNKSQPNIFNDKQYLPNVKNSKGGSSHSSTSLMSSTQKSVNFKENEIYDTSTPRQFVGLTPPRRTISPILKSRSLTPENKMSSHNIPKGRALKPLNITTNSRTPFQTKKIGNTIEKTESSKTNQQNRKSIKNTYSKPSSGNQQSISRNIEKYFDEALKVKECPEKSTPLRGNRQDSTSSPSTSPCNFQNEDSAFDLSADFQTVSTEDEVESIGTETNSNLSESYEVLTRVSSPHFKHNGSCQGRALPTDSSVSKESYQKEDKLKEKHQPTKPLLSSSEFYCENSNEDSGLDINSNGLIEFPIESESSNSECPTPVENIDNLSESNTDRTYEVNESTNIKCTCNFIADESICDSETVNSGENIDLEDKTKKENIRLFCDMLSNDLEQLPMEKFRKLKLKILQLVYAEFDECGSK